MSDRLIKDTLYVIIPTFKETRHVQQLVDDMKRQSFQDFHALIVNCNPGDETTKTLNEEPDSRYEEVAGSPDLFWTGAIYLGQKWLLSASPVRWFMFLNCDNRLGEDFLRSALTAYERHPGSVISPLTCSDINYTSSGARMRSWYLSIATHFYREKISERNDFPEVVSVDMLAGRALIFPGEVIDKGQFVDPEAFPHYAGDYEYTARLKRNGFNLYVCSSYSVYNDPDNTGSKMEKKTSTLKGRIAELFSAKCPHNIVTRTRFVVYVYPWHTRLSGVLANWAKLVWLVIFGART